MKRCTCLEQELDDVAGSGLVDNKRCHHAEHRRRGHPQTPGFLETNSEDVRLGRDAAERADGSDPKSERYSHK
jgi:hypothetical protein